MRRIPVRLLIPLIAFFVIGFYYLANCSITKIRNQDNPTVNSVDVVINFLIPMEQDALHSRITVVPELPFTPVSYRTKWLDSSTVVLTLDQKGYPKGRLLDIRINDAPTKWPFLKKSASVRVRKRIIPELITRAHLENVPTQKPLNLYFNTPIDEKSLKKHIILPFPGELKPVKFLYNGRSYVDYSRWQYFSKRPFNNRQTYRIVLAPGIKSLGGGISEQRREITFTTADAPKVLEVSPSQEAQNVKLYQLIEFTLDREIETAKITVTDPREHIIIPGTTDIKGNKVIFRPDRALLPAKKYKVGLTARARDGEPLPKWEHSFTTVDTGDNLWVDVKLGKIHTVKVYRGSILLRHMVASGGKSTTPTPTGYFKTQDRGHSFWSPRFGEGATYWVRLVGQILVHSVPRDSSWRTKEDEHAKLGLPSSHGCIRLDEKDAKWFYENIPMGTTVIIHE